MKSDIDADDWRLKLQPGERVLVRMDDGKDFEFDVKYSPWQLGHGTWVIGLHGKTGGYMLKRVVRKIRTANTAPGPAGGG